LQATLSAAITSKNNARPRTHQTAANDITNLMISKCANPNCSKLLMRLDGGRFFGFPTSKSGIEHFWLCISCSKSYTLKQIQGKVELTVRERKMA